MDNKIQQNILQYLHFRMKDRFENGKAPTTDELLRTNITKEVNDFIIWAITTGFYFSVLFTGPPSCGKSISALEMANRTSKLLWTNKKFKGFGEKEEEYDFYRYITTDEVEFNNLIMKGITNCCACVDELNDMNAGGDNLTVMRQIFMTNAEVNAQRYVYRFCATPRANSFYELTSLLIFRYVGRNDTKKISYWMVYYNTPEETQKYPLGIYESNVGEII